MQLISLSLCPRWGNKIDLLIIFLFNNSSIQWNVCFLSTECFSWTTKFVSQKFSHLLYTLTESETPKIKLNKLFSNKVKHSIVINSLNKIQLPILRKIHTKDKTRQLIYVNKSFNDHAIIIIQSLNSLEIRTNPHHAHLQYFDTAESGKFDKKHTTKSSTLFYISLNCSMVTPL